MVNIGNVRVLRIVAPNNFAHTEANVSKILFQGSKKCFRYNARLTITRVLFVFCLKQNEYIWCFYFTVHLCKISFLNRLLFIFVQDNYLFLKHIEKMRFDRIKAIRQKIYG